MKRFSLLLLMTGFVMAQPSLPRLAPRVNFLEDCRGKVTVVAFIVTSCSHCQAFSKLLETVSRDKPVCAREIAFNDDADVTAFTKTLQLTFLVMKLERGVMNDFMGVERGSRVGTPQIAIIDKSAMIQAQSAPGGSASLMQPEILGAIIDSLVKDRLPKP